MNTDELLATITRHLDERELTWQRADDVIMLAFEGGAEQRPDVTILIGASGNGVLVQGMTRVTVTPERVVQAVLSCNAWNGSPRLPKATVVTDDPDTDSSRARIVLESWLPYVEELPDAYLAAFVDVAITGSCTFFHELDVGALARAASERA